MGPIPPLGNTVKLTLVAGHWQARWEGVNMGELAPTLVYHVLVGRRESCYPFLLIPHHLQQVGELALSRTSCNTQENGSCT